MTLCIFLYIDKKQVNIQQYYLFTSKTNKLFYDFKISRDLF